MMLMVDPETREALAARVVEDPPFRPLFGPMVWREGHSAYWPHYQEGGNDTFDYVRKCRRECCRAYWAARLDEP